MSAQPADKDILYPRTQEIQPHTQEIQPHSLVIKTCTSGRYAKTPRAEAVVMQRLIMQRALEPKISAQSLAQLARAWDVLEERKRILRGKPLPGQLRPDLDPVQMARALKRARQRKPIEIPHTTPQTLAECATETDQESAEEDTSQPAED